MGKYDDVEVTGPEREGIISSVREQISRWGMTMPPVEPLLLDFGLGRFMETGLTEFWVANETEAGYCGKYLFVFDGQTCPYHSHVMKHETFFVAKGSVQMKVGNEERIMNEGDLLAMPQGIGHSFTGVGPALLLEVSQPSIRQDNFFADKNIGDDGVM